MMYVKYYVKNVPGKGIGTFAAEPIQKGTLIWKLTKAKRFSKQEFEKMPDAIKKDAYPEGNHYVQATGDGESWNHSCDSNTWWTADDKLSARRDILKDEEITYDYATTDIDPSIIYNWKCNCGATDCRKKLHWNDILKPEVYKKYKGHIPSWVEEFVKENKLK